MSKEIDDMIKKQIELPSWASNIVKVNSLNSSEPYRIQRAKIIESTEEKTTPKLRRSADGLKKMLADIVSMFTQRVEDGATLESQKKEILFGLDQWDLIFGGGGVLGLAVTFVVSILDLEKINPLLFISALVTFFSMSVGVLYSNKKAKKSHEASLKNIQALKKSKSEDLARSEEYYNKKINRCQNDIECLNNINEELEDWDDKIRSDIQIVK